MAAQIIHGGPTNKSNDAKRIQRETRGGPYGRAVGLRAFGPWTGRLVTRPLPVKGLIDTDRWGSGPFCIDLRLGSLHTRSVPHYHQNMSYPHNHHPISQYIHSPSSCFPFLTLPLHPLRAEYGAPKMKREHLLYVSVGALLKNRGCVLSWYCCLLKIAINAVYCMLNAKKINAKKIIYICQLHLIQ